MEEMQGISKPRRVYSFEPNAILLADFSLKYMIYLLPALLKVGTVGSRRGNKGREIEKIVRFEVDMALVLSAGGFAWSRALKHKLEQGMRVENLLGAPTSQPITSNLSFTCKQKNNINIMEMFDEIWTLPPYITRPLAPGRSQININHNLSTHKATRSRGVRWGGSAERKTERGLCYRIQTLRRILPGGDEMGVCELLSEVESYVVCLELQVSILRSLLDDAR